MDIVHMNVFNTIYYIRDDKIENIVYFMCAEISILFKSKWRSLKRSEIYDLS
jgi:hypothetical protein